MRHIFNKHDINIVKCLTHPRRQVGAPATCKNCLSVGASQLNAEQLLQDKEYGDIPDVPLEDISARNSSNLASFSSRGPTLQDGRFKPDLVVPGEGILSMSSQDNASPRTPNYCDTSTTGDLASLKFNSGTSMATPLLAGAMEFIRQYAITRFPHCIFVTF